MEYIGADDERHAPIMIHRALFGSIERFFGVLVEHYAGAFPPWLAPVQARVLPVSDDHDPYGRRIVDRLRAEGYRADLVAADESLGKRIRAAKLEKLPYVLVVGDDDVEHSHRRRQPPGRRGRAGCAGRRASSIAWPPTWSATCRSAEAPWAELDHLWAGWRSSYMDSVTAADADAAGGDADGGAVAPSLFERILALADEEGFVVHRGLTCSTLLNAYPYTSGHLLVLPNRAAAELDQLDESTYEELWREVRAAVAAHPRRLPLRRRQRGHEPGPGGRRRGARPPARARPAPLDRRRQLHDRHRR